MKIINIKEYDKHHIETTDGIIFNLDDKLNNANHQLIEMAVDNNEPIAIKYHLNLVEKIYPCFDEFVEEIYQEESSCSVLLQSMPALYKIPHKNAELANIFNNAYSNKLPLWVAFSSDGEIISASLKEVRHE